MKILFPARRLHAQVHRNHRRRSAQFSRHRRQVIARNRSNRTAHVHDFRRGQIRRKCRHHTASRHRNLHIAQTQKRMPAQKYFVALDRRHRARRINRSVALHQNHPRHIAGRKFSIVRPRRRRSALRRHKSVRAQLRREFFNRTRLKSRKHQRRFNRLQRRAVQRPIDITDGDDSREQISAAVSLEEGHAQFKQFVPERRGG